MVSRKLNYYYKKLFFYKIKKKKERQFLGRFWINLSLCLKVEGH